MTKKNVAALMLAGAMMTVGSGAMAEGEVPPTVAQNGAITGDSAVASVPITYSAQDSVNIVLNWNSLGDIKYVWSVEESGAQWKLAATDSNGEQTITFSAQNKGFAKRNVAVGQPNIPEDMTWLKGELVKISDDQTASNNKDLDGNAATTVNVAAYKITADNVVISDKLSMGNTTPAGNITFTVTVAPVNP